MPQRSLSVCKYEVNNILFDFNVGSFFIRFGLFLHADNVFFSKVCEMILKGLPDGGIKVDKNIRRKTVDNILSCVSPERKDIPIKKQLWFQNL